jgi:hypothetical protein
MWELFWVTFLIAALILEAPFAHAATDDEKKQCVQYDKQPITLTGTVLVRKIDYGKGDDAPPEGSVPFPLLVLDQNQFAPGVLMMKRNPVSGRYRLPTNALEHGQLRRA